MNAVWLLFERYLNVWKLQDQEIIVIFVTYIKIISSFYSFINYKLCNFNCENTKQTHCLINLWSLLYRRTFFFFPTSFFLRLISNSQSTNSKRSRAGLFGWKDPSDKKPLIWLVGSQAEGRDPAWGQRRNRRGRGRNKSWSESWVPIIDLFVNICSINFDLSLSRSPNLNCCGSSCGSGPSEGHQQIHSCLSRKSYAQASGKRWG